MRIKMLWLQYSNMDLIHNINECLITNEKGGIKNTKYCFKNILALQEKNLSYRRLIFKHSRIELVIL